MLCGRCHNVVPDNAAVCVTCGAPVSGRVDSYAATSFAPVMPPPSPADVQVRNPAAAPTSASGPTMMSAQAPPELTMPVQQPPVHPPTMRSPSTAPPTPAPSVGPRYVVTPAPSPAPQLGPLGQPSPYYPQSSPQMPYAPPPIPNMYAMVPAQNFAPAPRTSASGLAIASLICGLFGLVPFWIGFLLCLLAIIFGAIVITQTRPGEPGRGIAIAGLILGLCFVLPAACGL